MASCLTGENEEKKNGEAASERSMIVMHVSTLYCIRAPVANKCNVFLDAL